MEYIVKYLSVDGEHRAVVGYDFHSDNPRDMGWQDNVSVWTVSQNSSYHAIPEGVGMLNDLFDNIQEHINDMDLTKDVAELVLQSMNIKFVTTTVYAGRDWVADAIWYGEDVDVSTDSIRGCIKDYSAYCSGEVYSIELQKKVVYKNDAGDELVQWETTESTGGVYDVGFKDVQDFCSDFYVVLDDKEV